VPSNDILYPTTVWHFNSFSGMQLIFRRAGPSVAFFVTFFRCRKKVKRKRVGGKKTARKAVKRENLIFP